MRRRVFGATLAAVAVAVSGFVVVSGGGGGAGTTANVWVVHSGGSCSARQSTRATLAAAPSSSRCTSWPAAYQLARDSDVVGVETGASYATQSFTSCNGSLTGSDSVTPLSSDVTFTPDGGGTATANLQGFTGCGYNLLFRNVVGCPDTGVTGAHDLHFVGLSCVGGEMFMGSGGHHMSVQGSNFGPYAIGCGAAAKFIALWGVNNVLIAGSTFHDLSATEFCTPSSTHPDAIEACGAPCGTNPTVHHITVQGNRFWNNACDSGRYQDPVDHDFLIENNMFGAAVTFEGGCTQSLAAANPNTIVRYNSFNAVVDMTKAGVTFTGTEWYGNIFTVAYNCESGISKIAFNVGPSGSPTTCGSGQPNTVSSMSGWFTNATIGDMHLTSCSLGANNAGDPSNGPTTDFDGGARGATPDAGADECGSP